MAESTALELVSSIAEIIKESREFLEELESNKKVEKRKADALGHCGGAASSSVESLSVSLVYSDTIAKEALQNLKSALKAIRALSNSMVESVLTSQMHIPGVSLL